MRDDILTLLVKSKDFVSGEEISQELDITRATVWKNINELRADGGEVEAVTNKGYQLKKIPDILKPPYLRVYTKKDKEHITWLEQVDSTNSYAKLLAREGAKDGSVVLAEHQTGGRGRMGRSWVSAKSEAIAMSFIKRPTLIPSEAPLFNIAIAIGIVDAIKNVCQLDVQIKWPNDIVYKNKKLCGILIEMASDMDRIEYVVCGAGVNVNQQQFKKELAKRATSLRQIKGEEIPRVRLCAAMIDEIEKRFEQLCKKEIKMLLDKYKQQSAIIGKQVRVLCGKEEYFGTCKDFGEQGELILKTDSAQHVFHAGEVSVRGVNGYV